MNQATNDLWALEGEILQVFVQETQGFLDTTAQELSLLEREGFPRHPEVVKRLFRGAHTIKGSSAAFDLLHFRELAYRLETLFRLIDNGKLLPRPDMLPVAREGFSLLLEMVHSGIPQEPATIREKRLPLQETLISLLPNDAQPQVEKKITLAFSGPTPGEIQITQLDLTSAKASGLFVYYAQFDLIQDIERQGKTIMQLIKDLLAAGNLLETCVNLALAGSLEDPPAHQLPFQIVLATELDPKSLALIFQPSGGFQILCRPDVTP